jgi:hypothetical protein
MTIEESGIIKCSYFCWIVAYNLGKSHSVGLGDSHAAHEFPLLVLRTASMRPVRVSVSSRIFNRFTYDNAVFIHKYISDLDLETALEYVDLTRTQFCI